MNKIFIEAKDKKTPEYHFLKTIIEEFFVGKEVDFICMDGVGNLFSESIINQISQAQAAGEQVIVLADADTKDKGYGYGKREEEIRLGMATHNISFPYFLYPNDKDDGDVETLMEYAVRRDLHTYMNAQQLANKQRRGLGSGNWLFDNTNYWDLHVNGLRPLIDFLTTNLL